MRDNGFGLRHVAAEYKET